MLSPGELTYGYPRQQRLEKGIVFRKRRQHFGIMRDVYEDGEAVLGDGRIIVDDEFEVLDRLELIPLEEGYV
jgi:hypothetical protein